MKHILFFISCCALFGCKKQGSLDCKLVSIQSQLPITGITKTYEYDDKGRIVKTVTPSITETVKYYPGSITITDQYLMSTYYLNSSGLAASSKISSIIPIPGQIGWDNNYSYNATGYLIQTRSIFSRLENGNLVRDTGFISFTIVNGNVTEYWSGNVLNNTYEYTTLEAKENMAFTTHPLYQWPFLGKASKNLMSRMTGLPQGPSIFEYVLDAEKNIIERKEYRSGSPGAAILYYTYQCD